MKDQVWGVTQTRLQLEERDEDADGRAVLRGEVGVVVPPLDQTRRVRQVVERQVERLVLRRPVGLVQRELDELLAQRLQPRVARLVRLQRQRRRLAEEAVQPGAELAAFGELERLERLKLRRRRRRRGGGAIVISRRSFVVIAATGTT